MKAEGATAFRSVPRTGVIFVTAEAVSRGYDGHDPQWSNLGQGASWFAPYNEWDDATELANQAQADLEAGLG